MSLRVIKQLLLNFRNSSILPGGVKVEANEKSLAAIRKQCRAFVFLQTLESNSEKKWNNNPTSKRLHKLVC
jgi:hypothetical protein